MSRMVMIFILAITGEIAIGLSWILLAKFFGTPPGKAVIATGSTGDYMVRLFFFIFGPAALAITFILSMVMIDNLERASQRRSLLTEFALLVLAPSGVAWVLMNGEGSAGWPSPGAELSVAAVGLLLILLRRRLLDLPT